MEGVLFSLLNLNSACSCPDDHNLVTWMEYIPLVYHLPFFKKKRRKNENGGEIEAWYLLLPTQSKLISEFELKTYL
jgi:hypothetical protein